MTDMACGDPPHNHSFVQYPDIDYDSKELLRVQLQLQDMQLRELEERHLRDINPTVKDAWEQYQTVLRLAKDG